ncbi:hypothetical protein GURKE_01510 [Brevundimonas phage vB_BpoS-Gurke]|uniref:Uncharacterized protein n=1 Tax=Brevundimonas phage vB_BpoS-Gurke TaxID=2948599 RepID=A0A9E7N446_9CAUD|nr:hypothetical protein GURKE_01510 [Brevundimonas phage vB_BpoS-Gurke]
MWRWRAPRLLDLVPQAWKDTLVREHLESIQEWKAEGRPRWWHHVNMASGAHGIASMSANGDILYHTDSASEGFAEYAYLLILRPGGYVVTGKENWRGMEKDRPGDLICFRQHALHALTQTGLAEDQADYLDPDYIQIFNNRPSRLWMALTLDSDELLSRQQAIDAYADRLGKLPVNAARRWESKR